jgi:membrane protease YdiL (CAAX protease family)
MRDALRLLAPPILGALAAIFFDRATARRGLTPPGFATPWRRGAALFVIGFVLTIGVFGGLFAIGEKSTVDYSTIDPAQLFLLHALLLLTLVVWYLLGFPDRGSVGRAVRGFSSQLGLLTPAPGREMAIGLVAGMGAWLAVIAALLAVGGLIYALGGQEALPKAPPDMIPWIAGLPIVLRVGLSLSAGVLEELFFRGLLQPRVGILASTAVFAFAHLAYDQPLMLLGVTILSLIYGLLVRWRQNLWPAIVAHALFDGVQLLIVIPAVLRIWGNTGGLPVA